MKTDTMSRFFSFFSASSARFSSVLSARALLLLSLLCCGSAHAAEPFRDNQVSGAHILELTRQFLAVAPQRYFNSPGHTAAEKFIRAHFAPEDRAGRFEDDSFTANTPIGPFAMHNLIVKFPGKRDGIIVLASHYETNYPLKNTTFMGANDGAATTCLLIALGEYFRAHPPEGYSIWIVFDDGEEAVANPPYDPAQWHGTNALYGTRHLAAKWSANGTIGKIKAFLLADMIGDKNLDIDRDGNSTPALLAMLGEAAKMTNHTHEVFTSDPTPIEDDHLPFAQRGVPVLDIIDYDYGPHDAAHPDGWHHTPSDTIDKLSARSLGISADLFLAMIRLINGHG